MRTCPNCKKEVSDELKVCTGCGTRLVKEEVKETENEEAVRAGNKNMGIAAAGIALIGIFLLFSVSAVIGMLVYAGSFYLSLMQLKKDREFTNGNYVNYAKSCFKKEKFIERGIPMLIVILIPVIALIALDRWIFADTFREVDYMMNRMGEY